MSSFSQIIGIARNGMQSRMLDLDSISNNLANLQTTGYKSSRLNFQEMLNAKSLSGVTPTTSQVSMLAGTIEPTSNALDMAIDGSGFFSVKMADGTVAYTRDGHFTQDGKGTVVNSDGYPLVWSGSIPADATDIQIQTDGTVKAMIGTTWTDAGKVSLTTFSNPAGLMKYGENLWLPSEVSGTAKTGTASTTGYGLIRGSSIERSNVSLSNEMARMIRVQRAFQTTVTALEKTDQMISLAINIR